MKTYTDQEVEEKLGFLKGWNLSGEVIKRQFTFKDFKHALSFIVHIGLLADQAEHHPEINNVYNKVTLSLNTHSAKGITDKDFDLAAKINAIEPGYVFIY